MLSWIHFYPVIFPIKLGSITNEETVTHFFCGSVSLEPLQNKHIDAKKWKWHVTYSKFGCSDRKTTRNPLHCISSLNWGAQILGPMSSW